MTTFAADSAPVHLVDSKLDAKHEEYPDGSEASNTNARDRTYEGQGSALEKKLMRKIDFRLIPPLCFMYACALIDRVNLSFARINGMDGELGTFRGNRYTVIVLLFFPPYILTEIPANLALKAGVNPRLWLASATMLFGLAMLGHGFARNWYTVAGLRIPLGAFEGLLFPGAVFLISSWYPRYETQKRISAFYLGATGFAGFSAIFAYGFSLLRGNGRLYGRAMLGWRWIFIMSAVLTFASAIIGVLTIPNFPAKATFLTPEEKQIVLDRINLDRADAQEEKMTKAGVMKCLRDWKIWAMGFLFLCSTLPSYAFSYFLPSIILQFGFSLRDTQLLVAPPYLTAILVGMVSAYFSDKKRIRFPFIAAGAAVSGTGSLVLGYAQGNGARYAGAFLAVIGCSSNAPAIVSWSQNNVTGYTARAVTSAVIVASGGLGGIIASVAFQQKDAATGYRPGLWTTVASQIATWVVGGLLVFHLNRENRKVKQEGKIVANTPGFLYTL